MHFELEVTIARTPAEVFAFLRDKDRYPQKPGSPVLALEQTTPGPPGVGTEYREVVRMVPFVRGEVRSRVTRFEPGRRLDEEFRGPGMRGYLSYEFVEEPGGTRLIQRERLETTGLLIPLSPVVRRTLERRLRERLESIKAELDAGWVVELER